MSTKHRQKLNPHTKTSSTATSKPTKATPAKPASEIVKPAKSTSTKPALEQVEISDEESVTVPTTTTAQFKRCRYCVYNPKFNN